MNLRDETELSRRLAMKVGQVGQVGDLVFKIVSAPQASLLIYVGAFFI